MDSVRCRFLWQGTNRSRKKYALVKWSITSIATTYGGLGILDFRDMNIALLVKQWWKYRDPTYSSQWKTLLQFLYSSNPQVGSPFWIKLNKLGTLGSNSTVYTPGNTSTVRFWEDIWLDNRALATQFPQLYDYCVNKDVLFSEVINSQGQAVQFYDILTAVCLAEWNHILHTLSRISFTHEHDKLSWRWDNTGRFSVNTLYKFLNFRGVQVLVAFNLVDTINST